MRSTPGRGRRSREGPHSVSVAALGVPPKGLVMDIKSFPVYVHEPSKAAHGRPREMVRSTLSVAPWTAKAARNGNPVLPDEVLRVLEEECAKFPGPVQHDEVFAIVLNNTACRTAHLGMGLSSKRGGRRVTHPDPRVGEVAEDILQHRDTGHHWDVFGGAAVGNPLRPGQGPSIGVIDTNARPWVKPICDAVVHPEPEPGEPQEPTPPAPPPSPAPPSSDLGAVLARLDAIETTLRHQPSQQDLTNVQDALWGLIADKLIAVHIDGLTRAVAAIGQGGGVGGGCKLPSWMRSLPPGALAQALQQALKAEDADPETPREEPS